MIVGAAAVAVESAEAVAAATMLNYPELYWRWRELSGGALVSWYCKCGSGVPSARRWDASGRAPWLRYDPRGGASADGGGPTCPCDAPCSRSKSFAADCSRYCWGLWLKYGSSLDAGNPAKITERGIGQ